MTQIILSEDQARAVKGSTDAVEIRDEQGNLLGYMARPVDDERIANSKQRLESDGPWHSTKHVLEHLQSLDQE